MTLPERKKKVLELLTEDQSLSVSKIAAELGVSGVTVRADLNALAEEGLIVRTHGGAVPAFHSHILERQKDKKGVKTAIAKCAANMVENGDTIIITAGTTTSLIARYLLGKQNIHVVTNSTLILPYARINPSLRVTLIGGEFQPSEEAMVGPLALEALNQFYVSKAFIGVDGVSAKQGFTAHSLQSAELVRKMAEQADTVIAISDSSKFGKPGFARILPLSGVDTLVTDADLGKQARNALEENNVKIITASQEKN